MILHSQTPVARKAKIFILVFSSSYVQFNESWPYAITNLHFSRPIWKGKEKNWNFILNIFFRFSYTNNVIFSVQVIIQKLFLDASRDCASNKTSTINYYPYSRTYYKKIPHFKILLVHKYAEGFQIEYVSVCV